MATELGVFVRRRYEVSPDRLFRAFADPVGLSRWFSPSPEIATDVLEHDFREGGRYRLGFRFADGTVRTVAGVFRAIAPPSSLVMTWTWEPPAPHAGIETLVTVRFEARDRGTELIVTHDRLPRFDVRDRQDDAWRATLERLAGWVSEG